MMGGRRMVPFSSLPRLRSADPLATSPLPQPHRLSFFSSSSDRATKSSFRRRAIPIVLLSITGGFALSALNDIAIFHGCSKKAIEKATENQNVIEVLGTPIVRGPWYDASLAVGRKRNWVSCTFPVFGPKGSGIFQLKAVRSGDDKWWSFMRHHDWNLVVMELLPPGSSSPSSPQNLNDNIVQINMLLDNNNNDNDIVTSSSNSSTD